MLCAWPACDRLKKISSEVLVSLGGLSPVYRTAIETMSSISIMRHCLLLLTLSSYILSSVKAGDGNGICGPKAKGMDLYSYSNNLCKASKVQLNVEYNMADGKIQCGDSKSLLSFTNEEPSRVYVKNANKDKFYTLLMVDPDAPSSTTPSNRYWRHWLVNNIGGEDLKKNSNSGIKGKTVTEYNPPAPPKGSGDHRYQFFLFEHNNKIELLDYGKERGCFCVMGFVENNNLGDPVAATEFKTRNE